MKLCSDCRHFRPYTHTQDDGSCTYPQLVWVHPVSGHTRFPGAFTQRMSPAKESCGPDARFWDYDPGSPPEPELQEDMG